MKKSEVKKIETLAGYQAAEIVFAAGDFWHVEPNAETVLHAICKKFLFDIAAKNQPFTAAYEEILGDEFKRLLSQYPCDNEEEVAYLLRFAVTCLSAVYGMQNRAVKDEKISLEDFIRDVREKKWCRGITINGDNNRKEQI